MELESLPREKLIEKAEASQVLQAKMASRSFLGFCSYMLPIIEGYDIKTAGEVPKPAAHHRLVINALDQVERGEIKNLMLFLPPGSAKSTYASVLFPPYFMGKDANRKCISTSHDTELAEGFGKRIRKMVETEEYQRIFGLQLDQSTKAAGHWALQYIEDPDEPPKPMTLGEYWAMGILASVTGRRTDLLVMDDVVKGSKDAQSETIRNDTWNSYKTDFRTRLKPGCPKIYIGTRWHEDDPAGRILPENYNGESGKITGRDGELWTVICLPAIAEDASDPLGRVKGEYLWPEWFCRSDSRWFEKEKAFQGPRNWAALYQQRPAPEEGDFFKREWFRFYEVAPPGLQIYGASDYAVSQNQESDYTVHGVCGIDGDDNIYLLDWYREKSDSERWIHELMYLMRIWGPLEWGEEKGQILKSLDPFIRKKMQEEKTYVYRKSFASSQDKITRAQAIRGRISEGKLYLPTQAGWTEELLTECLMFPNGKHDDQVDVLSLFGRMLVDMAPAYGNEKSREVVFPWIPTPTGLRSNLTFNELRDIRTESRQEDEQWDL
jgi:predicted phage terminase large subunit-like protein